MNRLFIAILILLTTAAAHSALNEAYFSHFQDALPPNIPPSATPNPINPLPSPLPEHATVTATQRPLRRAIPFVVLTAFSAILFVVEIAAWLRTQITRRRLRQQALQALNAPEPQFERAASILRRLANLPTGASTAELLSHFHSDKLLSRSLLHAQFRRFSPHLYSAK